MMYVCYGMYILRAYSTLSYYIYVHVIRRMYYAYEHVCAYQHYAHTNS